MSTRFEDIDDDGMRVELLYLELLDVCGVVGANKRLDEWKKVKGHDSPGFPYYVDPAFLE
ncbi:hypothetical protein [Pseudomonas fluorescens]|uniref:hypothetical protein n=1 Tax=Pseudomonas fluorescens TaxID=294 RepID=UPI0012DB0D46|nr:hypothetical protein [Pseudomonas fluorescens]